MIVDIIAGARPNFVKIAPIIHAFNSAKVAGGHLRYRLIHTGQHYDPKLSDSFFTQLNIPPPDISLGVGSGSQAEQTANIMVKYESVLLSSKSEVCLVVGDVNSTMACALVAQKVGIPVAHIEAGIRSNDWSMPEEINRLVTDAITNWFFTTSEHANANLRKSGVDESKIFFVGNTMIDSLLANLDRLSEPPVFSELGLERGEYFVATLHRPANVDNESVLQRTLSKLGNVCRGLPVIFPVHPRTQSKLSGEANIPSNICLIEPQPYLEFNYLVKNSKAVVTDSGGVTEECTVLGIPCMTLRDSTERPETVEVGTNELLGTDPSALDSAMHRLFNGEWKEGGIPPLWDGKASVRIVKHLEDLL